MNNVLYEVLPTEWNGYHINTGFHIGVQISLLLEDEAVNERVRSEILLTLLFGNESGEVKECPQTVEEIQECLQWFLAGWNHDNNPAQEEKVRIMDYNIDQGRIYADFLRFYNIDLEFTEMHWWKFNWLLWNLPNEDSSFMNVIEIRTKKPRKGASSEEKKAIKKAQSVYGLKDKARKYSDEELSQIDKFDLMMEELRKNK